MSAEDPFNAAASPVESGIQVRVPKRLATRPFSIRLTEDERQRLAVESKGAALGAYIKAKLLGGPPPRLRRSGLAIEDRQSLAKVLALLGSSRIANNLNQLARLVHIGALPVTDEVEAELEEAVEHVRTMRSCLLRALGLSAAS